VVPELASWQPAAVAIALVAGVAMLRFKAPMTPVLAISAVAGLLVWGVGRLL
jgi:hypothetical protein